MHSIFDFAILTSFSKFNLLPGIIISVSDTKWRKKLVKQRQSKILHMPEMSARAIINGILSRLILSIGVQTHGRQYYCDVILFTANHVGKAVSTSIFGKGR